MKKLLILVLTMGIVGVIASPVSKQTKTSDNSVQETNDSINTQISLNNEQQQEEKASTPDTIKFNGEEKVEIILEENIGSLNPSLVGIRPASEDFNPALEEANPSLEKNFHNALEDSLKQALEDTINPALEENVRPILEDNISPILEDIRPALEDIRPPLEDIRPPLEDMHPMLEDHIHPTFDHMNPDFHSMEENFEGIPPMEQFGFGFPYDPERHAPVSRIEGEIMETAAGFVPTPLVFKRKNKPRRRFPIRRHFNKPQPHRRIHFFYPYYSFYPYRRSSLRYYY